MIVGYTSLMCPEAMSLPYLECLASWAKVCDKIAICFSTFPELDLDVPDGAIKPWEDDKALEILDKFDDEILGGKLIVVKHEWDPDHPREDGRTKQLARDLALKQFNELDKLEMWVSNKINKSFTLEKSNSSKNIKTDIGLNDEFIAIYDSIYNRFDLQKINKTFI